MSYYIPEDVGGNVRPMPAKNLRRSAANQLVPTSIQTREDRTVDHLSSWQLFQDGALGSSGSPSMPDRLAIDMGLDPVKIPAGDLSREVHQAVTRVTQNLEYDHRMSNANAQNLTGTEAPLRPYSSQPRAVRPDALRPGPGADYNGRLELAAGVGTKPTPGMTPGLGPKRLIDKQALLNPTTGIKAQNADALANTLESMPSGSESLQIPRVATQRMTTVKNAGLPETQKTLQELGVVPHGMKTDANGNPVYLEQAAASQASRAALPVSQPAQEHPSKTNYEFSDGQMRGLGATDNKPGDYHYDWPKIGKLAGLMAAGVVAVCLLAKG